MAARRRGVFVGGAVVGAHGWRQPEDPRYQAIHARNQPHFALKSLWHVQTTRGDTTQPAQTLRGCVMSYAYWHPAMRTRSQLLKAQTGRYDSVSINAAGMDTLSVRGRTANAQHWHLTGREQTLDL